MRVRQPARERCKGLARPALAHPIFPWILTAARMYGNQRARVEQIVLRQQLPRYLNFRSLGPKVQARLFCVKANCPQHIQVDFGFMAVGRTSHTHVQRNPAVGAIQAGSPGYARQARQQRHQRRSVQHKTVRKVLFPQTRYTPAIRTEVRSARENRHCRNLRHGRNGGFLPTLLWPTLSPAP